MATVIRLPDDPNFEQLRKQAKDLRERAGSGAPDALALIAAHQPTGPHPPSLAGAQLAVARRYGFPSWAALKRHVHTIQRHRRTPDRIDSATSPADRFLLLACLRYSPDDNPERWTQAAALLATHPHLTATSIHAAAAAADTAALTTLLTDDPTLAVTEGGPFAWEPLLYLAYARHDPAVPEDAVAETARLLLHHGADPNAGYLWHGLTTPFTALAGALGGGEHGQPPHPAADVLATALLTAGADPNDGQALYNRQFGTDDTHLRLLIDHGLGRDDGRDDGREARRGDGRGDRRGAGRRSNPWRTRLGTAIPSPADLIADQLWWAVTHDLPDRVRLLAECADLHAPFHFPDHRPVRLRAWNGTTPTRLAAQCGSTRVLRYLAVHGAPWSPADGADSLVAAALAGERATVQRLRPHADAARRRRPALIVWAAARSVWHAVPLLVELGFDVNARGRGDIPLEQPWETALHQAAAADDLTGAHLLIGLGADPNIRDTRFDDTPLGWAEHLRHTQVAHYLRPLTDR
ncbi:hypothetical protein ACIQF6_30725 [Kitasatospora sp. NPDC092948]|uniref:hypothetical protein n=1 Tax=Kitasatospora sp. NPDC092948 TaxID=3364088 RepID=UPI003820C8AA